MRGAERRRPLAELERAIDGPDDNLIEAPAISGRETYSGLTHDSREVAPGDVFVAIPGARHDGLDHVAEALAAGACAVIAQADPGIDPPLYKVRDARLALGRAARLFHGAPSGAMRVLGITGTNGKTTVAWMLRHLLRRLGLPAGMLGTVEYDTGAGPRSARLTTPDALELQTLLAEMRKRGLEAAIVEASSQGLELRRFEGCDVHVGVFTNLTRDHLDHHGTMEAYREAKLMLVDRVRSSSGPWKRAIVYDAADPAWETIPARAKGIELLRFDSTAEGAIEGAFSTRVESVDLGGTTFWLFGPGIVRTGVRAFLRLPGRHNLANGLAAVASCASCGIDPALAVEALADFAGVPGRLEPVAAGAGAPSLFVDYAHTPDAVERVLTELRPLVAGRLIALFGCGGDRDRGKRPVMGRAVTRIADVAILTNDNPRGEDPGHIVEDVRAGLSGPCEIILDRADAIERAIALAGSEDAVVLLGKGHEDYQILGRERRDFDDRRVAETFLRIQWGNPV